MGEKLDLAQSSVSRYVNSLYINGYADVVKGKASQNAKGEKFLKLIEDYY
ncbi:MAG: hypothetical protein INQ03_00750 [Candidatus Heimdallarchaeota archaeon]|nr:hypothetical protein [Candidatus Heimdallarchaeota archaeon]